MSTQGLTKEFGIVSSNRIGWEKAHRRAALRPSDDRVHYELAIGWSARVREGPRVQTAADVLPVVAIQGMPAAEYPKHVTYFVGYTLAAAAVADPSLARVIWTGEWIRLATVVVSARVGVWAATGLIPDECPTACAAMFRWSASLGKLIVRSVQECPESALFRHFVAQAPTSAGPMMEACKAMMWTAPPMLLSSVSRLVRSDTSYASTILEGVVKRHMRANNSAGPYLDLYAAPVWEAFRAGSTAGYGIERLKALAADTAFSASAQLRVAEEGAVDLKLQLEEAMAAQEEEADEQESLSDTLSVADTEMGSPAASKAKMARVPATVEEEEEPEASIPPPPLDLEAHAELLRALRDSKPMTPAWQSLARAPRAIETAVNF